MKINSYTSLYNIGHRQLEKLFEGEVLIEEKIDGSQLSFGLIEGQLQVRSKGGPLNIEQPEKMFAKAIEVIKALPLQEGLIYRGEYLKSPRHNSLCYDRVPKNHIMIFDISNEEGKYLNNMQKKREAERLGLECVRVFSKGVFNFSAQELQEFLEKESILGGQKIEGIVIKNYNQFNDEKKILVGKLVSDSFREVHKKNFKEENKSNTDIIQLIAEQYKTPARWQKGIIHLQEKGILTNTPKDIGLLFKEINEDILKECKEEILQQFFEWAWPKMFKIIMKGFPEWYKEKLEGLKNDN